MIRVGTSGWVYPPWRGTFYPKGLAQRRELEHLSRTLSSVEINGSFYALQKPASYQKWAEQTPEDFVFSVKGGRFITHMKRLVDVDEPVQRFFASGVFDLGPKLGPILWQLPPTMAFDADLLAAFFDLLPRRTPAGRPVRHALEVRHDSFKTAELAALLRDHDIALVLADSAGKFPVIDEATADFRYARLHGDVELYTSGYTDEALDRWAERFEAQAADGSDVFVYFDNDAKVRAPYDARGLLDRISC